MHSSLLTYSIVCSNSTRVPSPLPFAIQDDDDEMAVTCNTTEKLNQHLLYFCGNIWQFLTYLVVKKNLKSSVYCCHYNTYNLSYSVFLNFSCCCCCLCSIVGNVALVKFSVTAAVAVAAAAINVVLVSVLLLLYTHLQIRTAKYIPYKEKAFSSRILKVPLASTSTVREKKRVLKDDALYCTVLYLRFRFLSSE